MSHDLYSALSAIVTASVLAFYSVPVVVPSFKVNSSDYEFECFTFCFSSGG